ncbi:type II toxin-antitoxin system HipA family toxin [Candidatus Palauibacter sp.]|uniref:type II toxin-antitoxin system HipA family toxin n=1 Tax=Candidatus Palauibacter sp. TaxID=3101350 RepID=UPI003B52746D
MERRIRVHLDLNDTPLLIGRLRVRVRGDRESATFEYDPGWLDHPRRFALEPALTLGPGPFHTRKALFGSIGDSAPDRWGRVLMRREEARRAGREGRRPRALFESDYLLRVDDEARMGALRFSLVSAGGDGPFLAEPGERRVPPLVELGRLLAAATRVTRREERDEDLRLLIGPGASLGGARPKAAVRDGAHGLAIAKFPGARDDYDLVLWEGVALELAAQAGIDVPVWRFEKIAGRRVLLVRRFDREASRRLPFLSAMSMLGTDERESRSYLEIADALRRHGAAVKRDLTELWRRVVFSILISNTDDHLRNHGFLYEDGRGWRLSPAYDLNPTPAEIRPRVLQTHIDEYDGAASLDRAMTTAEYYGLDLDDAKRIVGEVGRAVSAWRGTAARFGASPEEIMRMESAFEHEDLDEATGDAAPSR